MIQSIRMKNYGPIHDLSWAGLGSINLIIGSNACGKTILLKALYSAMRTIEEYKRGDDQRRAGEILADKLYWTFQPEKLGDLVTKGADGHLEFKLNFNGQDFFYSFGKDTNKQINAIENNVVPRISNSIFLPAKEVLSLQQVILKSRNEDRAFGFDDTYFDLSKALSQSGKGGKNYSEFALSKKKLEDMLEGKIEFQESSGKWSFKKQNQRFPLGVTAEGVKKIAILDTLLTNKYLDPKSIIFFDEPECALHPANISNLLDIIAMLADRGIQFFLASHSYFVVKKLVLIAQEKNIHIPTITVQDQVWTESDLIEGMPDNPIISESVRLYEEEVRIALS
jgi:AAA15 family ATPase/GTPase